MRIIKECSKSIPKEIELFFQNEYPKASSISFEKLDRGLSHHNFKITVRNDQRTDILFGKSFKSSIFSHKMFEFSAKNFGKVGISPRVKYISKESMVMDFLEGKVTKWEDLVKRIDDTTTFFASFHDYGNKFINEHSKSDENFSIENQTSPFLKCISDGLFGKERNMNTILSESFGIEIKVDEEIDWVLKSLEEIKIEKNELVICHNDVHSENILEVDNKLKMLDFECAHIGLWQIDVANFFQEHCTFDLDLSLFPKIEYRTQFLKSYLDKRRITEYNKSFLERLLHLSYAYNNLYWSVWAMKIYLEESLCDGTFDYKEYCHLRIKMYMMMKKNPECYSSLNAF